MTIQRSARTSRPSVRLLPIPAAADRLGCSENHIYRLIAAGELDAVDIAQPGARKAKTRINEANLDAYVQARTRRAGEAPDDPQPSPKRLSTPLERSSRPGRLRAEIGLDPFPAA
jgi:excisionase family DNA binding protein